MIFLQPTKTNILRFYDIIGYAVCNIKTLLPLNNAFFKNALFILVFILAVLLNGCKNFIAEPENSYDDLIIPDAYYSLEPKSYVKNFKERWWENFASLELNNLVQNAIGNNFTLKEAWARLKQAQAMQDSQNSSFFPSINFSASAARKEIGSSTDSRSSTGSGNTMAQENTASSSYSSFAIGPGASYEIDLWGNINARILEYENKTLAARFDLETATMSVAAEISSNWVELILVREEIALVKKQVELNTILLDILELRFQNSMSTALDVLQQREVVAKSRARIPSLEIRESNILNAIALLCGKPSQKDIVVNTKTLRDISPLPQTGIPAELLSNRPDIKSGSFRLTASKWAVFQAKTNRLPSLNLNGSFIFQNTNLESILKNWVLTLASTLNAKLFDGGKNRAEIQFALGVMEERLAAYKKTVFNAIMEVENSIVAEKRRIEWIELLKAELDIAKLAMEEARNRYIKGVDSFIQVVNEELNVQNLEINLLEQKIFLYKNRIAMYRAVGGRWISSF